MEQSVLKELIASREGKDRLAELYPAGEAKAADRYLRLLEVYGRSFGAGEIGLFSAPGRTELAGNHTDHNGGRVLAAAVDLDIIAAASPREGAVRIISPGYPDIVAALDDLTPARSDKSRPVGLVRGVAAWLRGRGYSCGGFTAVIDSRVPVGSGLSSSAAFEVLAGTVFSHLYNAGRIKPAELALAGQYAENRFFGKPCGLMDQMASAHGGCVGIDFARQEPVVSGADFGAVRDGWELYVVDTRGSHSGLTDEYAAIPSEMKAVAAALGKGRLCETTRRELDANAARIRKQCGDRAYLRACHFFDEDERAAAMPELLRRGDSEGYLAMVRESGLSSARWLQNISPAGSAAHQEVAVGLYAAERYLRGRGACRVHGGGFAGTIQAYVPLDMAKGFAAEMERIFGRGCCTLLHIRGAGGCCVLG